MRTWTMNEFTSNGNGMSLSTYRPDIDGLRALAVLSVVGFHAFPEWVRGGFVGVDVFFVISGYLISSIVVNDIKNDKFSFVATSVPTFHNESAVNN